MICDEQKELSDYIKSVHLSLRCKSRQVGAEMAWKEHINNEEVLQNYAIRMKSLAEKYWSVNNKTTDEKCLCRIQWMLNVITYYFENGGMEREITKECKKLIKFSIPVEDTSDYQFRKPYKILDVGSCYDPFGVYDFFHTYPVDLCPAADNVIKCDFTEVKVRDLPLNDNDWFCQDLKVLPRNFFDIVVFSLFLEYLPCPKQRFTVCQTAYDCLKLNGLLLIATPDSKHEGANAGIMKIWKTVLAQIGFVRIKLEKLKYIYCMGYRKTISPVFPLLLYNIQDLERKSGIPIPQDSTRYEIKEHKERNTELNNEDEIREGFHELPFS